MDNARITAGVFLCILNLIMDVIAGILGFQADVAQNKVCIYVASSSIWELHLRNVYKDNFNDVETFIVVYTEQV